MSEGIDPQEQKIKEIKEEAKRDFKGLFESAKKFVTEIFDIKQETNIEGTIEKIKSDIAVKGHTAWILVFSILVASIGLNVSSTAVVIGAMLISPLMGPILGIGLSIGINDVEMLRRSMVNLGVMLGISIITSFLFFSIPLFQDLTPELYARTKPDIRDVLIAIAGGLALIVAISRPSPQTNTVAGVAIATALMPPLCTAGYGLAVFNINYFLGAMFLFTINTTFIALSAYSIVKYLHFPMKKYLNSIKKRRISRIASFVALVIISISMYTFYNLYKEKSFNQKANSFVTSIKKEGFIIIDKDDDDISYADNSIDITIYGKTPSTENEASWKKRLIDMGLREDLKLKINKGKDDSQLINEFKGLKEQIAENKNTIEEREKYIRSKDMQIELLKKDNERLIENKIPFWQISKEAKINYKGLEEFSYAKQLKTNFSGLDTIDVFTIKWRDSIPSDQIESDQLKINNWLKTRLDLDTLILISE